MRLSNIAAAALLATAAPWAAAAGGPLDLSSGSAGFSSTPPAGGFTDVFTFTLTTPGFLSGSITSVVSGLQDVDFIGIFLTGPGGAFTFTQLLADPFETWGLSPTFAVAGNYSLAVIGINSAAIGSYGGNLAVTAVPEPGPLALLLAGMGVVALRARSRATA